MKYFLEKSTRVTLFPSFNENKLRQSPSSLYFLYLFHVLSLEFDDLRDNITAEQNSFILKYRFRNFNKLSIQ